MSLHSKVPFKDLKKGSKFKLSKKSNKVYIKTCTAKFNMIQYGTPLKESEIINKALGSLKVYVEG
jgi:hypothetical protein